MSSYFLFNNLKVDNIYSQTKVIVGEKTYELLLPRDPLVGHKIDLFNLSGHNIIIKNNSKKDLIYSEFFCPSGESQILIQDKRKVKFTFMLMENATKLGVWFVEMY
jgi:hypothetical protein